MRTPRRNVAPALMAAGLLGVAACGSADDPVADTAAPPLAAGEIATDVTEPPAVDPDPERAVTEPPVTDPAVEPAVTDPAPAVTEPAVTEPAPTDAAQVVTDAPPPTDAAVQPAVLGGRALAEAVAAGSDTATNPLPDLVVDDVGRGTAVNLRNVFPADRSVLIWMWAPH